MAAQKPTVFFDGVCVICNAGVRFIVARDHPNTTNHRIQFCRVQSNKGHDLLKAHGITQEQCLTRFYVLDTDGTMYNASSAALQLAHYLPFPYPLLGVFWLVPKFLRDMLYDVVAKNRYKWFGKYDTCAVYREKEEVLQRFIDRDEIDSLKTSTSPSKE